MRRVIAILEDDPRRTEAMNEVLKDVGSEYEYHFFDNAPEMISWLEENLDDVVLFSLDHDLGSNRVQKGKTLDPGTGRDVVDFLSKRSCTCPAMIHSNNYPAVLGMRRALEEGGWKLSCVVPYGDLEWIGQAWAKELCRLVRSQELADWEKSMSEIGAFFISAARNSLAEGMRKVEHCVHQLNEEQAWWRPRPEMNSVANLILHLAGNMRQWIVSGVGGAHDIRNRPEEFADRSRLPKASILSTLRSTVREADAVMEKLPLEKLGDARRIQGFETNVLEAILDCVAHFRGHVQEIIHMTRVQLGDQYQFDFVPKGPEQESAGTRRR
jgi:hypothetical protein